MSSMDGIPDGMAGAGNAPIPHGKPYGIGDFVERTTGFEPATSTLTRHEQPTNTCEPQCFPTLTSSQYRRVRAIDGTRDGMAVAAMLLPENACPM